MDKVREIMECWGGLSLYIPALRSFYMGLIRPRVAAEYNGSNAGALARKYGIARHRIIEAVSHRGEAA